MPWPAFFSRAKIFWLAWELPRSIAQLPYKRSFRKWILVLPPTGVGPRTCGPRFSPPPLLAFVTALPFRRDLRVRFHLLIIAYVLGPPTDFFLPLLGDISPLVLARRVFGKQSVHSNVERVLQVLSGWGYGYEDASKQRCLATTEAPVMLVNRHQALEQITDARLIGLRQRMKPYQRGTLERLSKVLAHWRIIEQALPPFSDTLRVLPEHTDTSGIAPEWVDWCLQWHRFSDLTCGVKRQYLHMLFRTGRWLAEFHPEVTSPRQWTSSLAAEYVAAVIHLNAGDFCTAA
jgi:hypothetical protein